VTQEARVLRILLIAGILALPAWACDGLSDKLAIRDTAPEGSLNIEALAASLQRCPDTKLLDGDNGTRESNAGSPRLPDQRDRIFYPDDTERPKPLLKKLFLNVLYDQKDIFTSPFHVNRHNALEWIVPMAATGGLIAADTHIANAFENSRGQVRWGGRISNIGASYTLLPIIAGSYGYGAWRDNAKAREIGVLGTESLLDSLIVVGVMKEAFRRNRPDERNPGDFWGGGTSFPSGHAIQVWSVASLLAHEYKHKKYIGITAYSLAGIVSVSRVAARKHFASDVFAGGAMGWFIGAYVYNTHMSHLAHTHISFLPKMFHRYNDYHVDAMLSH
jgi:membrane-associated phospholipid phosphatase